MRVYEPGGFLVLGLTLLNAMWTVRTMQDHIVPMNRTESACFSLPSTSITPSDSTSSKTSTTSSKILTAQCPFGQLVYIVDLFYGHSRTGSCRYSPGDCVLSDFVTPSCVGRAKCEINLPSGSLGRQIPHCREYSNYMQLVYRCIPETEVYDICTAGTLRTQSGYVRTPGYPNNYPASQECTATITVHPTQRLKLHVVELDLESDPAEGCLDLLYVQGTFRTSSLCGHRTNDQVFTTVGSSLNLTFTSDAAGRNKGFWLYYEAFPYMEPTTPSPTTSTTTTKAPSTLSPLLASLLPPGVRYSSTTGSVSPPGSSTPNQQEKGGKQQGSTQEQQRLPLEAIVGGLLGSLLCILLVLLILLIIKRRKEREAIPSSTSTCFLHSKGGAATAKRGGAAAPYIQNNLAMVDDSPMC